MVVANIFVVVEEVKLCCVLLCSCYVMLLTTSCEAGYLHGKVKVIR